MSGCSVPQGCCWGLGAAETARACLIACRSQAASPVRTVVNVVAGKVAVGAAAARTERKDGLWSDIEGEDRVAPAAHGLGAPFAHIEEVGFGTDIDAAPLLAKTGNSWSTGGIAGGIDCQ
mmetsp:Transcript_7250/g.22407  ORF Transcript_7250/g.22407 Transcript_7250/m.22407 type:complete len:120 (+) Transcript_7250:640-999(+)